MTAAAKNVDGTAPITDLDLTVDIDHSGTGTLSIDLVSPNGTVVPVVSDVGQPGVPFIDTTFDDEATTPIASGTPPYLGRFQPQAALSTFDGELPAGQWTLILTDSSGASNGTLNSWSLTINQRVVEPGSPGLPAADAWALVVLALALIAAGGAALGLSRRTRRRQPPTNTP